MQEIDTLTPDGVFLRYDEPEADAVLERERALELERGLEAWVTTGSAQPPSPPA